MNRLLFFTLILFFATACEDKDPQNPDPQPSQLYFPPVGNTSVWETTSAETLGWDVAAMEELSDFLEQSHGRAFIIIKDGKIVMEEYYGNKFVGNEPFDASSNWYWASAAKTLTGFLVGLAQEENLLNINDRSSDYLGTGWTSLTPTQENEIKVWNQLTMSSGMDDGVADIGCTDPPCLQYLAAPGTRWAYHNAPYTRLDGVIEGATDGSFDDYFNSRLRDKIGMDGFWTYLDYDHLYFSTARSMARFGLLALNQGKWDQTVVMADQYYFDDMTSPSQDMNSAYGYLWWLNGQNSFMLPGLQIKFNGFLTPNAPDDMFAAMGKNGQLLNIVPSQGLVVVRMGNNPDNVYVPTLFQDELWGYINQVIN